MSDSQTGEEPSHSGDAACAGRILIVDDVAMNREILKRRLVRRGFSVIEAEGGYQALEMLEREPVDLVLLDIMMPDLDGLAVVRTVRETHSAADLPIIMVSAKSRSSCISISLEAGANDYITKPVDFTAALDRIRAHLTRKRDSAGEVREGRTA